MYKNLRKGTTIVMASLILATSVPSHAALRFKDVPTTHWGYTYIEDMASLGYIKGMDDGSFQPDGVLNFDAAISLLARLTNPTITEQTNALAAYNSLLTELKIADWAKPDLAVALYNDIISESQITLLAKNNQVGKPISKISTCGYFVKAMGLEAKANSREFVALTYTDALTLSAQQGKYVATLIDVGVLDPKGQGDGTFGGNTQLTRAVMAKMMSTAYEYMEGNGEVVTPTNPEKPVEETEKVDSVITGISDLGQYKVIMVESVGGGEIAYQLMENTVISVDDNVDNILGLKEGQKVELSIKKGTREIISVKAKSVEDSIDNGKIKSINTTLSKFTIEYIENNKTVSREFFVDKNAYIYLDGIKSDLKDLKEGDILSIRVKNNTIIDIEAKKKDIKVEGIISEITAVKDSKYDEYYITIIDSKDKSHKFLMNNKTYITRNKRTAKAEDLKLKDNAYIVAEYDVVKDIDAEVVKKNVKGQIRGLNIAFNQNTELTILNQETKKEEKYALAKDVYIRVDRTVANSRDLNVGYYVEVVVEGDEIKEIEADSKGLETSILGKIQYINTRTMEITLLVENFDLDNSKYGEEITIRVKNDVIIADRNLKLIPISYLVRGDRINVVGSYDGSAFIADTIQLR